MEMKHSIAAVLSHILHERGISASGLSGMLGHRSKTTVNRILQGKAGDRSVRQVCGELLDCAALGLDAREVARLEQILRWGVGEDAGDAMYGELERLLSGEAPGVEPVQTVGPTVEAVLEGLGDGPVEGLLINAGSRDVTAALCRLGERLTLRHYLAQHIDPTATVAGLQTAFALAGAVDYRLSRFADLPVLPGQGVQVLVLRGGGVEYELLFPDAAAAIVTEGAGLYAKWQCYAERFVCVSPEEGLDPTVKLDEDVVCTRQGGAVSLRCVGRESVLVCCETPRGALTVVERSRAFVRLCGEYCAHSAGETNTPEGE